MKLIKIASKFFGAAFSGIVFCVMLVIALGIVCWSVWLLFHPLVAAKVLAVLAGFALIGWAINKGSCRMPWSY